LDQAFASDRPFVIDAVTDPNVPPLPPHITLEQAKSFTSSLLRGDVETLGLLKQTMKEIVASARAKKG
jgi:pyruvate dehydrogenase (quinone)